MFGSAKKDKEHHVGNSPWKPWIWGEEMYIAEQFRKKLSLDTSKQNAWIPFETSEWRIIGKPYRL
ncbi:hypothetical protein [Tenacibaculum maritimum]|uniref:hypothetical protein n=1 Tax=Tenacibaculum maritimum TaxID=107401 RepID=UPI003875CE02